MQLQYLQNLFENFKYKFVHFYKATGFDWLGENISNNVLYKVFFKAFAMEKNVSFYLLYLLNVRAFRFWQQQRLDLRRIIPIKAGSHFKVCRIIFL